MTRGAEITSPSSTIANWSVGGVDWLANSSRVMSAKALVPSESKSMLTTHSPLRLEELMRRRGVVDLGAEDRRPARAGTWRSRRSSQVVEREGRVVLEALAC